jgi:hypothetical protein
VGLFKRNKPQIDISPAVDEEFQRLSIREVLVFTYWGEGNLFAHIEKDEKNSVKAYFNGSWYSIDVSSRSAGTKMMNEILTDWASAKKSGLLPENVTFYAYGVKKFGFAEVDFSKAPEDYSADFIFALGRELDEKLRFGWFPKSQSELALLFNYFVHAPLRVGFFGSFKFVLKAMTNQFPEHVDSINPQYASQIAAAIGFGYGRLEGYIARVNRSPKFAPDWSMDELRHLPELNGFHYPRLKTIQYLLRKGWRFLDYLESQADPLVATRFSTHVLRGSDTTHNETDLAEERYLEYQQLTTRIIYGKTGLAVRDRESRKVILGPRYERHNLAVSKKFIAALSPDQVQAYTNWMANLTGKNSAVTHYALALSQVIPGSEFNWTSENIKTLFNSESKIARESIWNAIENDPTLLRHIPAAALAEFLGTIEDDLLDKILAEIKSAPWFYGTAINIWVAAHLNRKLNETELKTATAFLLCAWSSIQNNTWQSGVLYRDTLFFQVAQQSKLEPFAQWKNVLVFYTNDEASLLGFYGIAKHAQYSRGLLDVLNIKNEEMLTRFVQPLVNFIRWSDIARTINVLSAFYNSDKPGAIDLVWTILGRQLIDQEKLDAFLEHLNTLDPSGSGYLRGISSATSMKDHKAVLRYLINLSAESKEPFWRRNKGEMETILMGWKEFPIFVWNNLHRIPLKTLERIRKFEGLSEKILKQITPSFIARMNNSQVEYFVFMLAENSAICSNVSMLRAMLTAPNAAINERAAAYVKSENKFSAHWLLMLESNLPVTQQAALQYLETQVQAKDFSSKLLMALDSNNHAARKMALAVLSKIKTPSVLSTVVDGLVENRNTDTWKVVSKNLELISDTDKYKEFTSQVFLTRRKARTVKEEIKVDIEELIEDISEAVEKDTLMRMAFSSVASDRDWALKQIALTGIEIEGVSVERAWRGDLNV